MSYDVRDINLSDKGRLKIEWANPFLYKRKALTEKKEGIAFGDSILGEL